MSSMTAALPSVKHIRLFGARIDADSVAVYWLLRYAGRYDAVEHVDVNIVGGEHKSEAFSRRNAYTSIPFLEVVVDGSSPKAASLPKVGDLSPWRDAMPCTTHTASGEQVAEPTDRVFSLTKSGAICTFLAEHYRITQLWNPRGLFQRSRIAEFEGNARVLAVRLRSMVLTVLFSKAVGVSSADVIHGIATHEKDLLWSFRIMEDLLVGQERAAAAAAGLDYDGLTKAARAPAKRDESTSRDEDYAEVEEESDETSDRSVEQELEHALHATSSDPLPRVARHVAIPALVALDAFIAGPLSMADLIVTSDLQALPCLQSWLPPSLGRDRFPAIARYLVRMRRVPGFEEALRPRLSFMKVFRRRPKIMASCCFVKRQADAIRGLGDNRKAKSGPKRCASRPSKRTARSLDSRSSKAAAPAPPVPTTCPARSMTAEPQGRGQGRGPVKMWRHDPYRTHEGDACDDCQHRSPAADSAAGAASADAVPRATRAGCGGINTTAPELNKRGVAHGRRPGAPLQNGLPPRSGSCVTAPSVVALPTAALICSSVGGPRTLSVDHFLHSRSTA